MYNKHKSVKIMYQAIIDNKVSVQFNTSKKRDLFISKVEKEGRRKITCISSVSYPWNLDDGNHNLKSKKEFAQIIGCSVEKVERAIKNGFLETEHLGNEHYIVEKNDTYWIKGCHHTVR
ncbi:hypothetical protein [Anaerovorax sp. IOR16]|uniref:hypothetical protein n=1 Tax=Anaerovorax sp. IOR16 TaxID=2773458 RepID=UPI0019D2707D|nr:hypothetical protein [Anaerovorax sp. IOR16]